MLAANPLVDFEQDTIRATSVHTFEKRNGKSSLVKFTLDQDIRVSSTSYNDHFFRVGEQLSFCEVVVCGGHPTLDVPYANTSKVEGGFWVLG